MTDMVFDFGNAFVKWFNPKANHVGAFRHAMVELSDAQWRQVVGRSKTPPEGYALINGQGYAFGDAARRWLIKERPRGATRYQPTYYGVFLAYALSFAMRPTRRSLTVFASHAPRDIDYADSLRAAAVGTWRVATRNGEAVYNVGDVLTFDEPLGGYSHYVFTEKGIDKKQNPLLNSTTLVIDCGGYTVDAAIIDPGGEIDIRSLTSTLAGVLNMLEDFERELRSNNRNYFRDAGDLDVKRVEAALETGQYRFQRTVIDCKVEAMAARNALVNDIVQMINQQGGLANFDYVLLTGGGAALLLDDLKRALPQAEFLLAEKERAKLLYANVYGGAKLAALSKRLGEY